MARRRKLVHRPWVFPTMMVLVGVPALAGGAVSGTAGWVGLGLLFCTVAVAVPATGWLLRRRDGSRLHGAACAVAGLVALTAAVLMAVDAHMFFSERGRWGAAVVLVLVPMAAFFGARLLWWGARLVVAPEPGWLCSRRRARPHRLPPGERVGGGFRLAPRGRPDDGWLLADDVVASAEVVGPPVKGQVVLRAELAVPFAELDPPAFVRGLWVDERAVEFPVPADQGPAPA